MMEWVHAGKHQIHVAYKLFMEGKIMSQVVLAVFEQGLLRPLKPLNLKEHQTIRLQIISETGVDKDEERLKAWIKMGLVTPAKGTSKTRILSKASRTKLADSLGKTIQKPLSEIIMEERGEW